MISKYFFTKSYINENSNLTLVTRDAQNNRYISTKMCFTIMCPAQVVDSNQIQLESKEWESSIATYGEWRDKLEQLMDDEYLCIHRIE